MYRYDFDDDDFEFSERGAKIIIGIYIMAMGALIFFSYW
tara:strand:+ start:2766 stop:2882 length:117 start_codon:yes stop_codon:yes gene_type:complete